MHLAEGILPLGQAVVWSALAAPTVVAVLRPNAPPLQHKLHKPTDAVDAEDLVQVCKAWGFDVQIPILSPLLQEN